VDIPQMTIIMLLGIVFCAINPILPPVCLLYFLIVGFFNKYRVLYVARPTYATGGQMWLAVFNHVITALVMMQIVMTGYLSVKKSKAALFTAILVPLTLIARAAALDIFRRPLASLSLRAATDMDAADAAKGVDGGNVDGGAAAGKSPYLSPAMAFDGSDLAPLRAEAAEVAAYLAGTKAPPPVEDPAAEEKARDEVAAKQHSLRVESRRTARASSSKKAAGGGGAGKAAASAEAGSATAAAAAAPSSSSALGKPASFARARSAKKEAAAAVPAPVVPPDTPSAPAGPATTYEEAIRRAASGRSGGDQV
jgi:hypothetical protein